MQHISGNLEPKLSPPPACLNCLSDLQTPQNLDPSKIEPSIPKLRTGPLDKKIAIFTESIRKLFVGPSDKDHITYNSELEHLSATHNCNASDFLYSAIAEIEDKNSEIIWKSDGQIDIQSSKIPEKGLSLIKLALAHADIHVCCSPEVVVSPQLHLSKSFQRDFIKILGMNEALALVIIKEPSKDLANEINKVTNTELAGLTSLLTDPRFSSVIDNNQKLNSYLDFATVRVLTTATSSKALNIVKRLNEALEENHAFEDIHWARVAKSVALGEKQEALGGALKVCLPVIGSIFALHHIAPKLMNILGGVLDDIFGAVVPNISQSWGPKEASFKEKLKNAMPIIKGGAIGVGASFGFGLATMLLYSEGTGSLASRGLAGLCFALACSAGTIGSCVAAFRGSLKALDSLKNNPQLSDTIKSLSWKDRLSIAFRESILDSPFRIGHVLIGVPTQIAAGIVAGIGGFLSNPIFVGIEGMTETLLGIGTAFVYPAISGFIHRRRLDRTTIDN